MNFNCGCWLRSVLGDPATTGPLKVQAILVSSDLAVCVDDAFDICSVQRSGRICEENK
jgi:hypothetical protein